ncbi:MAG: C39 family peptidase [Chthoniobacteraceae bacterium]
MSRRFLSVLLCVYASGFIFSADSDPQPDSSPSPAPTATGEVTQVPLDPLLQQSDLWGPVTADFSTACKTMGFRWISTAQDTAQSVKKGLTLFNITVNQAIVRFAQGKPTEIGILFYNRGDAGELTRPAFEALKKQCADAITGFTKVNPTERGKDPTNAVRATGLIWQTGASQFLLEDSFTKTVEIPFRAEFIRLTVTPLEKPKGMLEQSLTEFHSSSIKFSGLDHVKTLPNGDVYIDGIPMVDQGDKGYCVVASAERVIRYYGGKADEHELAEIANSSAEKGTSVPAMLDSLKKLSQRLRIKVRTIDDIDDKGFENMITEYNRAAQHGRRAQQVSPAGEDSLTDLFEKMDPEILREARTKNPSGMDRFFRLVQTHINQGIPPLWSVMIGILKEPKDPKGFGGHMRLIIGYNDKTKEIIYSDSWGMGHEMKRMPLSDAWTITMGLDAIEPL